VRTERRAIVEGDVRLQPQPGRGKHPLAVLPHQADPRFRREPIKRIAVRRGFGCEETMRRGFARIVRVAPRDYGDRFSR
jgi:hypothetical protein